MAKRQTKLFEEAIASFNMHTSDDEGSSTSFVSRMSVEAAYMSNVAASLAHERRGIRPGVVCVVNDTGIQVASRTESNITRVSPHCVMMDSGAQAVIIGKRLAQELKLTAEDLAPCPFTIVTFIGHME